MRGEEGGAGRGGAPADRRPDAPRPTTHAQDVTHIPRDAGVRAMEVFMCSILRKSGYGEGFK